jgi:integrase
MASIYKKGNTWTAKVVVTQPDGKKKSYTKNGLRTKSAAQAAGAELELLKKNKTIDAASRSDNFYDYYEHWFTTYKENTLSPSTIKLYQFTGRLIEKNLNKPMQQITRSEFQTFLNDYGATRSRTVIKKIRSHITQALMSAIDDGITTNDFTARTTLIYGNKGKPATMKFWNKQDVDKVINNLKLSPESLSDVMIYTALQTGARFSEVAGLSPSSVDYENKTITISKNWNEKIQKFTPTKNEQSNRTIKVSDKLLYLLKTLNSTRDHLFVSQITKRPPSSTAVNKRLKTLAKTSDVHDLTFHGLRHTHASMLLSESILIQYISERLGHENTTITLQTYAHLLSEKRDEEDIKAMAFFNSL